MSLHHRVRYLGDSEQTFARCSCRMRSTLGTRQQAEDWWLAHLTLIERTKAHLRSRVPSVEDQYRYFREMEGRALDSEDRRLWKQLADELEHRLPGPVDQPGLW